MMGKNICAYDSKEANERARQWKSEDPFPQIPPALLNSADILAYADKIAFVYPFDKDSLKGAAYDVKINGKVVWFELDGVEERKREKVLSKDGDYFDLNPNSIAFVTLEPRFMIPDYMAFRFNLKITHIYKGLLLGTGPLVEPGFIGRLSIPLHNLTKNKYRFFKGDSLIQLEFTKLSPHEIWNNWDNDVVMPHDKEYIPNHFDGDDRQVDDYIRKALKKDRLFSVISSIPDAMAEAKRDAEDAREIAAQIEKRADSITKFGMVAVAALIIACIGFSWDLIINVKDQYSDLQEKVLQQQNLIQEYRKRIETLEQLQNASKQNDYE